VTGPREAGAAWVDGGALGPGGAAALGPVEEHATPMSPTRIKPVPREARRIAPPRALQTLPGILVFTGRRRKGGAYPAGGMTATLIESGERCASKASSMRSSGKVRERSRSVRTAPASSSRIASGNSSR
jgi:hypothetical protein